MFARGLVSLHTPPLLGRKLSSVKSRISITYKLIQNKRLQLHYFGHLRKTGGRGSYRMVHTANLPVRKPRGTKSNLSRTLALSVLREGYGMPGGGVLLACPERSRRVIPIRRASKPFISPTYAKTRGVCPCGKCRRADILDFSPYISHFLASSSPTRRSFSEGGPTHSEEGSVTIAP
jgi:hypothetical protein